MLYNVIFGPSLLQFLKTTVFANEKSSRERAYFFGCFSETQPIWWAKKIDSINYIVYLLYCKLNARPFMNYKSDLSSVFAYFPRFCKVILMEMKKVKQLCHDSVMKPNFLEMIFWL